MVNKEAAQSTGLQLPVSPGGSRLQGVVGSTLHQGAGHIVAGGVAGDCV